MQFMLETHFTISYDKKSLENKCTENDGSFITETRSEVHYIYSNVMILTNKWNTRNQFHSSKLKIDQHDIMKTLLYKRKWGMQ